MIVFQRQEKVAPDDACDRFQLFDFGLDDRLRGWSTEQLRALNSALPLEAELLGIEIHLGVEIGGVDDAVALQVVVGRLLRLPRGREPEGQRESEEPDERSTDPPVRSR